MSLLKNNRPIHVVINPHSGQGGHRRTLANFRYALRDAGLEAIEYTTQAPQDATDYARRIAGNASAVVVWGGDGTANEIASGLAGTDVPMLACPIGTENLLAKELRIPSDPRRLVDVLQRGQVINCDVGRINDRNFLMIIGVGFDGEVVRRLSVQRSGHISYLSYFWPIWRTFWEHDFPRMRIVADGEEIFDDYGLAFVGNISRYAVGLRICRDARFDDGLLDVVVFSCQQQTALLLHATWTLLRRHPLKGNVIYRQCRGVQFETDQPVPCQVDGDLGPSTPLAISLADAQVKLIVPRTPTAPPPPRTSWIGGKWI